MDDERSQAVNDVIRKGAALLVGMAVLVAVGTWLFVHALGLNDSDDPGPGVGPIQPASPLPSTALAVPGQSPTDNPTDEPTAGDSSAPPSRSGNKQLRLSAAPAEVSPMERVNLTGTYGNRDNVSLQVQRWEDGTWGDFPISVDVSVGTFATYVQTSRSGVNRFRVYDPAAHLASNVVKITVH